MRTEHPQPFWRLAMSNTSDQPDYSRSMSEAVRLALAERQSAVDQASAVATLLLPSKRVAQGAHHIIACGVEIRSKLWPCPGYSGETEGLVVTYYGHKED